jgi:hypothetical protein
MRTPQLLLVAGMLFAFTGTADAGFFKKCRERRQASTSCSTGSCSETAASNGPSFTSVSSGQTVVCNAKGCQVVSTSAPAPGSIESFLAQPKSAPDTIVIDGRSYRLTPISPP